MLSKHSDELIGSSEHVYKLGGLVIPPNFLLTTSLQSLVERKCIVDKLDSGIKDYMKEFINQVSLTKEQVLNSFSSHDYNFFTLEPFDIFRNDYITKYSINSICIKKKDKESDKSLCELIDGFKPRYSSGYINFIIDYDNMSIIPINLTGEYIFEENNTILSLLDKRTQKISNKIPIHHRFFEDYDDYENVTKISFTLKHQFYTATNKYLKTIFHDES